MLAVLLIDPCPLGRMGLRILTERLGQAATGVGIEIQDVASLETVWNQRRPDLIVLVVRHWIVEAPAAVERLLRHWPESSLVLGDLDLLSDRGTRQRVVGRCVQGGLRGYFSHETPQDRIREVLAQVSAGNLVLQNIRLGQNGDETSLVKAYFELSEREREVLALLIDDLSNAEIADQLHISRRTVESHKNNIRQKFGVRTAYPLIQPELASVLRLSTSSEKGNLD